MLNAELSRLVIRTLLRAGQSTQYRWPAANFGTGKPDALCRRFEIDLTARTSMGRCSTLVLADVYLELVGGRQPGFELAAERKLAAGVAIARSPARPARPHAPRKPKDWLMKLF